MPLLAALLLLASTVSEQALHTTSAYTRLDLDACKRTDDGSTPEYASWLCSGYGSLALFVQNGDERYDLDAGRESGEPIGGGSFNYPGETVEWRLFNGTPFAIIYRLRNANPDLPASSVLVVESVGRGTKPGCRVAVINGSLRNANERARQAADALLVKPARCLRGE